jgi:hypothetical protein
VSRITAKSYGVIVREQPSPKNSLPNVRKIYAFIRLCPNLNGQGEPRRIILDDTLTYLLTYLLTQWGRVLLEKLTGFAASQEIPLIYGTRKFITLHTSACHLSLSRACSIQYPQPPSTSWRSLLILISRLRLGLPNGLFPSGFPTKTMCTPLPSPYAPHAHPISFFSNLHLRRYIKRNHYIDGCDMFTKSSHHTNIRVILITQNLFYQPWYVWKI